MTVPQRRSGWPTVHLAMGFVVAVAVYLAADRYATTEVAAFLKDRRQALYAALVSVHITMLGFALATLTVVLGYAQSPRFQVLRDSPWFTALSGVFTATLGVLALAFAAALTGLLFDRNDAVLTALAAGSTVAALARVVHLLSVPEKVVRVVTSDPSRPPGASTVLSGRGSGLCSPLSRPPPWMLAARQTLSTRRSAAGTRKSSRVRGAGRAVDGPRGARTSRRRRRSGQPSVSVPVPTNPEGCTRLGSGHDGLSWRGFSHRALGPARRRAQVPGSGGVSQVVRSGGGVGAAAAKDRAGCLGDGLGGLPDTGEVSPGPAGDVGEGVATGVQAVRGRHDVRDALGLDLTPAAAGGVGRQVTHVPGLDVR